MLKLRDYLIDDYDGIAMQGRPLEITIDCPECGKGSRHFSFNTMRKKGQCFKCTWVVKDAVSLISKLEGINTSKAKIYYQTGSINGSRSLAAVRILNRKQTKEIKVEKDTHINANLPEDFISFWGKKIKLPDVLSKRKYSESTIKKMNIGYCKTGNYRGRLIFPILCDGMTSFFGRRIHDYMKNKYKNPYGAKHSQLLYNYDNIKEGCDRLIVVEGATDVCRMVDYGWDAVGTSGKKISTEQIDLIIRKKPKEVISLFDGEAIKENYRLFKKLSYQLNTILAFLPENEKEGRYYDPDDCPKELIEQAIKKGIGVSRSRNAVNILSKF